MVTITHNVNLLSIPRSEQRKEAGMSNLYSTVELAFTESIRISSWLVIHMSFVGFIHNKYIENNLESFSFRGIKEH